MSPLWRPIWSAAYLLRCIYYLALDKIDRSRLNVVFYRDYAGLPAGPIRALARDCYREVIVPRRFVEATEFLDEHRAAGRLIVLVTGSIDFIIEPLARELGIEHVIAPSLVESDGCFTGELDGPPVGDGEKARRMNAFADQHGIDMRASHAFGDSIADLPMLEAVGHAHAVNPDKALAATAARRGWPIHRWAVATATEGQRSTA